jgi:hypothetical protein
MSRLIVLPVSPLDQSGYGAAVQDDVDRLGHREGDVTVIYPHPGEPLPEGAILIPRPSRSSPRRYVNLLRLRTSTETSARQLRAAIGERSFSEIFCGEVTFYRALREIFPNQRMTVRFHNLFSLPRARQEFRKYTIDPSFRVNLALFSRLERAILRDPLVDMILIAEAERQFVKLLYPSRSVEVWNPKVVIAPRKPAPTEPRLAYMGSLASHQRFGMQYFIDRSLPEIRRRRPEIEIHMYGKVAGSWNAPEQGVLGHGFHEGDGPPLEGNALFACPDLLGGGIKIKIGHWLEWGLPIIATPYALDGYDLPAIDNLLVADIDDWPDRIVEYFDGLGLTSAVPGDKA